MEMNQVRRPTQNQIILTFSPAKIIENRSKCHRQLSELRNLKDEGLISNEDYDHERSVIMGTLKKFQAV